MPQVNKALEENAKVKNIIREKENKRQEETLIKKEININTSEEYYAKV